MPGLTRPKRGAEREGETAAAARSSKRKGGEALLGPEVLDIVEKKGKKRGGKTGDAVAHHVDGGARRGPEEQGAKKDDAPSDNPVAQANLPPTGKGDDVTPARPRALVMAATGAKHVSPPDEDQDKGEDAAPPPANDEVARLRQQNELLLQQSRTDKATIARLESNASEEGRRKAAAGKVRWGARKLEDRTLNDRMHGWIQAEVFEHLKWWPDPRCLEFSDTVTGSLSYRLLVKDQIDVHGNNLGPVLPKPSKYATLEEWWYQEVVGAVNYKLLQLKNAYLQKMKAMYKYLRLVHNVELRSAHYWESVFKRGNTQLLQDFKTDDDLVRAFVAMIYQFGVLIKKDDQVTDFFAAEEDRGDATLRRSAMDLLSVSDMALCFLYYMNMQDVWRQVVVHEADKDHPIHKSNRGQWTKRGQGKFKPGFDPQAIKYFNQGIQLFSSIRDDAEVSMLFHTASLQWYDQHWIGRKVNPKKRKEVEGGGVEGGRPRPEAMGLPCFGGGDGSIDNLLLPMPPMPPLPKLAEPSKTGDEDEAGDEAVDRDEAGDEAVDEYHKMYETEDARGRVVQNSAV